MSIGFNKFLTRNTTQKKLLVPPYFYTTMLNNNSDFAALGLDNTTVDAYDFPFVFNLSSRKV